MPGKRIVVTGATRGLGRAMTSGFVEGGHTVLGCGRSEAGIRALCGEYGEPHRFEKVDVAGDRAVQRWVQRILDDGGPPDLLINNAAVINATASLWEVPAEEFDQLIDVNIKGVVNVLRHLVPPMAARKRGVIVNFSSGWGRSTSPGVAPYCASKWAIEGLTRALAQELPRGMAAVALNPGIIETDMLRTCFGDEASSYPSPTQWARQAVPFLLALGPSDNGKSLSVPD